MNSKDALFLQYKQDVESILEAIEILGNISKQGRNELISELVNKYNQKNYGSDFHATRFKAGLFDSEKVALLSFLLKEKGITASSASNIYAFNELIRRLEENGMVVRLRAVSTEEFTLHGEFGILKRAGLLDNVLFGMQYTLEKYLPVIPAINVSNIKYGDQYCGTGIVACIKNAGEAPRQIIVTNRHVVDPERFVIDSILAKEHQFKVKSEVYLCKDTAIDLAAFEVESTYEGSYLTFGDNPTVLDPVTTVGFPRIPFTKAQYALGHRGEVNGEVATMSGGKLIVISCNVNPGNSGGPVLSNDGRCVGMVTESLFESPDVDSTVVPTSPYSCAIPAGTIRAFITEYLGEIITPRNAG